MAKTQTPKMPEPAETLDAGAKEIWKRTIAQLVDATAGNPLPADLDAFAIYCTSFARWSDAEKHIADDGPVVKMPSGYPGPNPFLSISNTAAAQVRRISTDLGLTGKNAARRRMNGQNAFSR